MDFTITKVNPLDHAEEIKRLFVTNERSDFPSFFDRAYPSAVRSGGMSWVGRDSDGHAVMHVGVFPHRFRFGAREVLGGLMVNALVAQAYRSFFPARALMKRARQESQARGDIDFLYTDPNEQARAVLEVSGFVTLGEVKRYVLPVGDRHWLLDRAIRVLHAGARVANLTRPCMALVARRATEFSPVGFDAPLGDSPALRPYHDRGRYVGRIPGYPTPLDWWFTAQRNGDASAPVAGLLVRGPEPSGVATLYAVCREPRVALASLVPPLIAALRSRGCTRLDISTLAQSRFAAELRRAGFVPRSDNRPLLAAPLTQIGEAVVRAAPLWEITGLDCDR